MVRGAFHSLRGDGIAHEARVLDPAAGAGVFLISSFRQLVAERWRHDGKRPDTRTLREILYGQIVGFDINEAALRFAALGLYLIAIELDPEPEPVEKLRFEKEFRGLVLHNLSNGEERSLGSLGKSVGAEHFGRYDLVIGNPPWASSTKLSGWKEVQGVVQDIAKARLEGKAPASLLPDEPLDLPFVWRSMQWAKLNGQIAFALHARVLFLQGSGMTEARTALFSALDVSGVVNGAELRNTQVWPEISAPFCLIFARNKLPSQNATFRLISPRLENYLNSAGILRLDSMNSERVSVCHITSHPTALKTLFRGSSLDLEIINRMGAVNFTTLNEYWRGRFGEFRGHPKQAGNGYQRLRLSSRVRKSGDGKPGVSAAYLKNLPELSIPLINGLVVDVTQLNPFNQERIHDPRPKSIFLAPLLVIHESPPIRFGRVRVCLADSDLVYNQSFHGYSAYGDPQGSNLIKYLTLVLNSKLVIWYALMTSGRFGIEREVVEKITIDRFPIVPFEAINLSDFRRLLNIFNALCADSCLENWEKLDTWVAGLYGLTERDLQVIDDTLRFNLPFAANKKAAQIPPSSKEIDVFCETLKNGGGFN